MTSFEIATIGAANRNQVEWLKEIAWQLAVQNDELPVLRKMIAKLQERVDKLYSLDTAEQGKRDAVSEGRTCGACRHWRGAQFGDYRECSAFDFRIQTIATFFCAHFMSRPEGSVPSTERSQPAPPPQPSEPSSETSSGPKEKSLRDVLDQVEREAEGQ